MEAGTYVSGDLAAVAHRGDELGRLARVFDAMADHVRAREARLKDRGGAAAKSPAPRARRTPRACARRPRCRPARSSRGATRSTAKSAAAAWAWCIARTTGSSTSRWPSRRCAELLLDPGVLERFKSEIRLARHISNKHVVRTHDIGEHNGVYYLTMEYVEGITVRSLLDTRGRLGVAPTLAIASQLAQSLAAAHEQGVIHRDIKPQNLLLDANGVLKVMDFGVARLQGHKTHLTEVGTLVGTPSYMAPEQLLSEDFDERADLYSAGVVLFECLTGRLPFEGTTIISIIAHVMRDEAPAPSSLNGDVPAAVSALVLRLLAKEPGGRPASAVELVRLLSDLS